MRKDISSLPKLELFTEFQKSATLLHALMNHTFKIVTQVANSSYIFSCEQLDELELKYSEVHKPKVLVCLN